MAMRTRVAVFGSASFDVVPQASDSAPVIGELSFITDGDKTGVDGSYVELGPELQWGDRENFSDGFSSDDLKIQFSARYDFGLSVGGGN